MVNVRVAIGMRKRRDTIIDAGKLDDENSTWQNALRLRNAYLLHSRVSE
jgi:hypothetical protein